MKICRGEEPDMSGGVNVWATYTYVETSFEDDEEQKSPPQRSDLAERSLLSAPRLWCSSSSLKRHLKRPTQLHHDLSTDMTSSGRRLDLLCCLPPEIAVYILGFLHPRYLCRVVQVSRRWWWLAQYSTLRKKRQKYLQHKRDKYLQSKENAAPGQRHSNRTPCTVTRQSLANCGNSPLTSVQCSRHRHTRLNSPRGERNTDGETPIRLPRYHHHHSLCRSERQSAGSPLFQTPEHAASDAYTTTDDELSYMVRRCLFPNSPALSRQKQTCHPVTDCDNTQGMDSDLSIKKTASRRRLKRL